MQDDLFASEVVHDPYTYFGSLREEDPVHWNARDAAWLITRYDDVVWLTRHPELFSSAVFMRAPRASSALPQVFPQRSSLSVQEVFSARCIRRDRPTHTAMRQVVHGTFTPRAVEQWRPMVQSVVHALLDEAEAQGRMEVLHDFAMPMTVLVMAQIVGLPHRDRHVLRALSEALLSISRWRRAPGERDRIPAVLHALLASLTPLGDARRTRPADDLLSVLACGEQQGALTRQEVLANTVLLLAAGHETTINLIGNGLLAFLRHPAQWAVFTQAPGQYAPLATEECLRYDPPVKSFTRIAMEDVPLRGKVMRQGERVRWVIAAANRDPAQFVVPDIFDIRREPNPHIAFGSGMHHCLGATLARLEGQEAFTAFAQRLPSLALATDAVAYQPSLAFRALTALPVSW
jgi:cytochrome P450